MRDRGGDRSGLRARRSARRRSWSRRYRARAARRPSSLSPIPYSAATTGIQLLTQQVAAQAGPLGVRVNCIAPETILTEQNAERIPAGVQAKLVDGHPVRRLGTPEDVAQAALYLASDASGWISGVILDVAGGSVMR